MAYPTAAAAAATLEVVLDGVPVPGMGIYHETRIRTRAVTLEADIAVGVTGLAGAQIAPCLDRVIAGPGRVTGKLPAGVTALALVRGKTGVIRPHAGKGNIAELPAMGLELEIRTPERAMTGRTISGIVAPGTALGVHLRLQRMKFEEIAPVTLGHIVATVILCGEVAVDSATGMAIQAPGLIMTIAAFARPLCRGQAMRLQPVCAVIRGHALRFMAVVAVRHLHVLIVFVGLLLGAGLGNPYR